MMYEYNDVRMSVIISSYVFSRLVLRNPAQMRQIWRYKHTKPSEILHFYFLLLLCDTYRYRAKVKGTPVLKIAIPPARKRSNKVETLMKNAVASINMLVATKYGYKAPTKLFLTPSSVVFASSRIKWSLVCCVVTENHRLRVRLLLWGFKEAQHDWTDNGQTNMSLSGYRLRELILWL